MKIRPKPLEKYGDWKIAPLSSFPQGLFGDTPPSCFIRRCSNTATCMFLYWIGGRLQMWPLCSGGVREAIDYFRAQRKEERG